MARRRAGPGRLLFVAVLFGVFAVISALGALDGHHRAQVSDRTQHHGVPDVITVRSVGHVAHHHKSGTSYDSTWTGPLDRPVAGRGSTTVHLRGYSVVEAGTKEQVLVDPDDPGYAEPVGRPFETTADWVAPLVLAIVFGAAGGTAGGFAVRGVRRRRRARGAAERLAP